MVLTLFAVLLFTLLIFVAYLGFRYKAADHSQYDLPIATLVKPASQVSEQHNDVLRQLADIYQDFSLNIKVNRTKLDQLFARDISAEVHSVDIDGVAGEWVLADGADPDQRLLYIHGGAFIIGSPKSHRYICSEISKVAGVSVLSIDYRMQPEFKTVDCHTDVRTAYEWIFKNGPASSTPAANVFVAGDSAGGNLTLAVIAWARDRQLAKACAAIALAPLTDSSIGGPSWRTNAKSDPALGPALGKLIRLPRFLIAIASRYSTGAPVNDPAISPLLGNLNDLPPTLLQVSRDEMLYSDSQRYANKARASGSEVTLQVWPTMVHVFQAFGPGLPEAAEAFERIGQFINSHKT